MFARRIVVVGAGYVGLTTAACLASLGHQVVCADIDEAKLAELAAARVSNPEPGLAELVSEGVASGRLSFVLGTTAALTQQPGPEVVFLCLPTPMGIGGVADLSVVESVVTEIGPLLAPGAVVVTKSTVPVGFATRIAELLDRDDAAVVSNPEFLREGSAVADFLGPDRIVLGADAQDAAERVGALYARLGAPTVYTNPASAELIKYAANGYLAMKLSYVNAVAELCERVGAEIGDVTEGMGYDRRIGQTFLSPGPGWGGSCLPKDTAALLQIADSHDFEFRLLRAAIDTNTRQRQRMVDKVRLAVTGRRNGSLSHTRLCLLGLTFKAGTDDLRDSPALAVAALLRQAGAELFAYDPGISPEHADTQTGLTVVDDPYLAAKDSDAVIVLTEWPQFRSLDWARLGEVVRQPVVVDTRNLLDRDTLGRAGFSWVGVGSG
ncbi:MAG: UDP-glucose/GDP-mannose dehydrogenase family protein [Actinomycetota bacterium]|nr:UDP-glucose/GDP-mannose dehydrogenase family protein [Actinomycetota bacterium]